jgi:ABC-type uncharacterized transport system permease subunit
MLRSGNPYCAFHRAAFAGVPVTRTLVLVALLSGGLAGLAGAIEVAGRTSYVTLDMSPGYGYSGIVIARRTAASALDGRPAVWTLTRFGDGVQ